MFRKLCLVAVLSAACATVVWSQQTQPPKAAAKVTDLYSQLDADSYASALDYALLDMSRSLIADNGLGIDVAPPEAALRAQLGLEEAPAWW